MSANFLTSKLLTNCLSVFDHFPGSALKGLNLIFSFLTLNMSLPNPVKHLKTINHFRKRLHLRCLAGFWIQSVRIRSSHPEVLLGKGVLKICSKFTREHPCQSVISIKFASLLKSHFDMGALLYNCCIFSEHLYI